MSEAKGPVFSWVGTSEAKRSFFSLVWDHFTLVNPRKVQCSLCSKCLSFNKNTSAMLRHLRSRHPAGSWSQSSTGTSLTNNNHHINNNDISNTTVNNNNRLVVGSSSALVHPSVLSSSSSSSSGSCRSFDVMSCAGSAPMLTSRSDAGSAPVLTSRSETLSDFLKSSVALPMFPASSGIHAAVREHSRTLSTFPGAAVAGLNPMVGVEGVDVDLTLSPDPLTCPSSAAMASSQRVLDEALVNMLVDDCHPFSLVEECGFSAFVHKLKPDYTLPSKKDLQACVAAQCDVIRDSVMSEVERAESISLSSEVWTTAHGETLVSVTGHVVTEEGQLKTFLLGVSSLPDNHKTCQLEDTRNRLLAAWAVHSKVVALVTEQDLCTSMSSRLQKLGVLELPSLAGVLNQALLRAMEATQDIQEIRAHARNIAGFFRSNGAARDRLETIQEQLNGPTHTLLMDTDSRWNSVYSMLESLYQQRESIAAALSTLDTDITPRASQDYDVISQCLGVLGPFHQATEELCSETRVSASKVIPLVYCVTQILEKQLSSGALRCAAATLASNLQRELASSFSNIETEPVLALATLLDPRFKVFGFRCQASCDWAVKLLTEECAELIVPMATATNNNNQSVSDKDDTKSPPLDQATPSSSSSSSSSSVSVWDWFDNVVGKTQSVQSTSVDAAVEVQRYLNDPYLRRSDDPIGYWDRHRQVYPHLYRLARKYLSVPASASPPRYLLSQSGERRSQRRRALNRRTVEMMMGLNHGLI